ncbi:hypothetical protein DFS33DRAFT_1278558 [Desarmillaria ectypa]|nr:hypothetical protein DFS33DRAFT_1278558 [Desarmillaria ectypa]
MVSGKRVHWEDSIEANRSAADEPKKASVFLSKRHITFPSSTDTTPLRRVLVTSMSSFNHPSPASSQQPIFSQLPEANSTITAATSVRHVRAPSIPGVSDHVPLTPSQQGLSSYNRTPPSSANLLSSHRRLQTAHQTRHSPSHALAYRITASPQSQISPAALHPFAYHLRQPPPQKSPLAPTKTSITHAFLPFQRQSTPQQSFLPLPNHSLAPPSPQVLTPSWKTNLLNNRSPNTFKQTPLSSQKLLIHRYLRLGTCEPIDFFAPQRVRAHASVASEPASRPPLPRLFILVNTGSDRFNIEVVQHQGLGFVTVDNVLERVQTVLRERLDPQTLGGSFAEKWSGEYMERRGSFTTLCVGLTVRKDAEQVKWKMHLKKVDTATR